MFGNKNERLEYHDRELERLRENIQLLKKIIKIIVKDTENDKLIALLGLY